MLQKSARCALAVALALALCPAAAFAVDLPLQEDSSGLFISASEDVYEESSLALPPNYLPESFSGELASSGILKGWGDYLYYLPETPSATDGGNFAYNVLERYNVTSDEWESLVPMPTWLTYCSATMFGGNFVVAGVEYNTSSGQPTTTEHIYMYDIDTDAWLELESDGVNLGASIVNLHGQLVLVGGADTSWSVVDDVMAYDTDYGLGDRITDLALPAFCPQLAVNNGQIYVYSYGTTYSEFTGSAVASQNLQIILGDEAEVVDGAFPDFLVPTIPSGMPSRSAMFGSLAAATEGLMLVGPTAADNATDTFILDWEEGTGFLPYFKRASDSSIFGAAACLHNDHLYAAASSEVETEYTVFRATEMLLAPMVQDGNNQVWRKGSTEPLVISYTPDFSRYYDEVVIDDAEEPLDKDYYEPSMGSTVISLFPDYLNTLAVGEHSETVYFDGMGAAVTAYFTIEDGSVPPTPTPTPTPTPSTISGGNMGATVAGGVTRPAALALTGDAMLIIPFAVIGIGAVGLGVYLIRRKTHNR